MLNRERKKEMLQSHELDPNMIVNGLRLYVVVTGVKSNKMKNRIFENLPIKLRSDRDQYSLHFEVLFFNYLVEIIIIFIFTLILSLVSY